MGTFRENLLLGLNSMILSIGIFAGIIGLILFISTGFNLAWTILLHEKAWIEIPNTTFIRIDAILLCVCSFVAFMCLLVMYQVVFYFGNNFIPHFITALVFCLCIIADIVFSVFSVLHSQKSKRTNYQTSFGNLINQTNPPKSITNWMKDNNCDSVTSCQK